MIRDRLRRGLHHRRSSIVFLLPSLTGVLLFYVLPFGVILYYSVQSRAVGGSFVGLQNYLKLFRNSAFLLAAKNTALQMLITVPLGVLLPLGLALILERSISARSSLRAAFLSPFFVPTASVVLVWQVLFHQNGTLNALLNLNVDWFHSSFSQIVTITLCLWKNIGYHTILLTSALASIPRNYLDMARLDGAGPVRCFFYIKIRFLAPSIFFVSLMSYMAAVKIFREVYLLTGAYPFDTLYLLQHFMNNTFRAMDYPKLCSAAILLTAVTGLFITALLRTEQRLGKDLENE